MFGLFDAIANINWEVIFQLLFVGLIVVAGPAVIFVLAFRNGDL
jgi:Photosystem II complex subunit Ycf12